MKMILKILIIVLIIAALGIGAYSVWIYLIAPRVAPISEEAAQEGAATAPKVPVALTEDQVFDYWVNQKTNEIYYLNESGQIYKVSDEQSQVVSAQTIGNLNYIKANNDGTAVVVAFGYPAAPTFAIYSTAAKTWQALPADTTAAVWDPSNNNRLAYLKSNRLYLLTLLDQKSREALKIDQKDTELEWVTPDVIYFVERPSAQLPSSIWSYSLKTKAFKTVIRYEPGLIVRWSPDGQRALKFTSSAARENTLALINANNQTLGRLSLITLPSKCAFDDNSPNLYCAATHTELSGVTLPDDYLKRSVYFQDDIYLVSLIGAGEQFLDLATPIFSSEIVNMAIDADKLSVDANRILFINRYDGKLYNLSL